MASLPGNLVTVVADRRRSTSPLLTSFLCDSPSIRSELVCALVWTLCCCQMNVVTCYLCIRISEESWTCRTSDCDGDFLRSQHVSSRRCCCYCCCFDLTASSANTDTARRLIEWRVPTNSHLLSAPRASIACTLNDALSTQCRRLNRKHAPSVN